MDFKTNSWLNRNKRKRSDFSLVLTQNSNNTFDYHFDEDTNNQNLLSKSKNFDLFKKLPIDWSLKKKIRFSSSTPFPWQGQFKACEDATGITSFVRCVPTKEELKLDSLENEKDIFSPNKRLMRTPESKISIEKIQTSHTAELRRFCLTWIYPNFPWLNLFPRIVNKNEPKLDKINKKQENFFKESKSEFCKDLKDDWCSCLKSLYHLLRARQCAFFYVCSNNFTILFRAAGVGGFDTIHAIITPTTSGFRKMLEEEEINYTMPLIVGKESNENLNEGNDDILESTEDSGFPVEEDSQIFLESLGLSQQDFPSMKSIPKKSYNKEDNRKTLVFVKGKDTNLLITFLTNTDTIIPTTGPLTGIPPTLLSPVAFSGSSLYSLKLKTSTVLHNNEVIHNLDLTGPILPNLLFDLFKFFENTKKSFNASIVNCEATSLFTEFSSFKNENNGNLMSIFASENLKECGLSKELIANICKKNQQSKKVFKTINVDTNGYKVF